jgi:hypothetical protein
VPVRFQWFPDRIERSAEVDGLELRSTTFLPVRTPAVVVRLELRNATPADRPVTLRLGLRGSVTKLVSSWSTPVAPAELDNASFADRERSALTFRAKWSSAFSLQGAVPAADIVTDRGLEWKLTLRPGQVWHMDFVDAVGGSLDEVRAVFDRVVTDVEAELDHARRDWDAELEAVFTPGNDRYSGWMPTLETSDADVRRLYYMGILGVVYFKRDHPASAIGRAYDTLMPRYWQTVTFLWDYHLSSLVHAMLDPHVMRGYLERWMATDIHTHFGTEWLTGAPVGCWYAVNDYAMTRTIHDYVRFTGDRAWLNHEVMSLEGEIRPVYDYVDEFAMNWTGFLSRSGLADYGKIGNLLECVSSYVHEVASLNAANVWALRAAADIFRMLGDADKAEGFGYIADLVAKEVMSLYAQGRGWWHARKPDGKLVEVRHAYDFITVLNTLHDDITETQRTEMVEYFVRELRSPTWMHALSCADPDAMFSVRTDHQWTGAYTAWPAQAVTGLFRIGEDRLAMDWMRGLARSANQGPFGQAHFAEPVLGAEAGGALKAPPVLPFITDWACSSGGAWTNVILESLFGIDATLTDGLHATPRVELFDPDARLVHVPYQGRSYTIDRAGVHPE